MASGNWSFDFVHVIAETGPDTDGQDRTGETAKEKD